MDEQFLISFAQPFSNDVVPFDLMFNEHFANDVNIYNFSKSDRDYIMGFMVAILTLMTNQTFETTASGRYRVEDIWIGFLGDNGGLKTVAHVSNVKTGRVMILIQNFFFKSSTTNLNGRGLSISERKVLNSVLHWSYEEKIVEYLIYDINVYTSVHAECGNQSNRILKPYMERILHAEDTRKPKKGAVKEFMRLSDSLSATHEIIHTFGENMNEGSLSVLQCNIFRKTQKSLSNVHGFMHGILLMTERKGLKVRVTGGEPHGIKFGVKSLKSTQSKGRQHSQLLIAGIINILLAAALDNDKKLEKVQEYFSNFASSIKKLDMVSEDSDMIRSYIIGMSQDNLGIYDAHLPIDDEIDTLVIEPYQTALPIIVFNFDPNASISIHGLQLDEFLYVNARRAQEALIISIADADPACNAALSRKSIKYMTNIKFIKQMKIINSYTRRYAKIQTSTVFKQLMSNHSVYAMENLYNSFESLLLKQTRVLSIGHESIFYFLGGFFGNALFYGPHDKKRGFKTENYSSRTSYTILFHFSSLKIEMNFFNTFHVGHQKTEVGQQEGHEYRVLNFVYYFNQTDSRTTICGNATGTFSNRLLYKVSSTYNVDTSSMSRNRECRLWNMADKMYELLPEFYKTLFHTNGTLEDIINTKHTSIDLSIGGNLKDISGADVDLLSAAVMEQSIHSTGQEYMDEKKARGRRSSSSAQKTTSSTKLSSASNVQKFRISTVQGVRKVSNIMKGTFLKSNLFPGIGLGLSVMDLYGAIQNLHRDGTSAGAIYDVASAAVGLVLGVVDLVLPAASIMKYVVFAITSALYVTSNIRRAIVELERVSEVIEIGAWQKPFEFFSVLFTGSLSNDLQKLEQDKAWNDQMMENIVQVMNANPNVHQFISSTGCYENKQYRPCPLIYIDYKTPVPIQSNFETASAPSIPANFLHKFRKNCLTKNYGINGQWIEGFRKAGMKFEDVDKTFDVSPQSNFTGEHSFICHDAFGVQRKIESRSHNDITIYRLDGNSVVFAHDDNNNVFRLSGGFFCRIVGGARRNTFHFESYFPKCMIVGGNHSSNTLDISNLDYKFETLLIGHGADAIFWDSYKLEVGRIMMQNVNNFVFNSKDKEHNIRINCRQPVGNVELKEISNCEHPLYNIVITDTKCVHNLNIESHGCITINSRTIEQGQIMYTFHTLSADAEIYLQVSAYVRHKIVMTSFDIHEFDLTIWKQPKYMKVVFLHEDISLTIKIQGEAGSVELLLGGGAEMQLDRGGLVSDIVFPKSIGQLWYKYRKVFSSINYTVNVYSHKDREAFMLENGLIRMGKKHYPFNAHISNGSEKIRCKPGYNIIVVEPLCAPQWKIFVKKLNWFHDLIVMVKSNIHKLNIDLTLVLDHMNQWYKYYTLSLELNEQNEDLHLTIYVILETEEKTMKFKAGTIGLAGIIVDNKYEKVVITAESKFCISRNREGIIQIQPLPKIIDSLRQLMLLEPSVVEKNQTLIFKNHYFNNYDVVIYQGTTLLITNLVNDVFKMFMLTNPNPYFHTIIVKNFEDEKMCSIKLEFGNGLKLDLMNLNPMKTISFPDFIRKLRISVEYIGERMSTRDYGHNPTNLDQKSANLLNDIC